jgi:hypothetical protein
MTPVRYNFLVRWLEEGAIAVNHSSIIHSSLIYPPLIHSPSINHNPLVVIGY